MERDLVRIAGRSLELGRPFLYGTTKRFLQVFGLGSIDDLPHREWFESEPPEIETQEPEDEEDDFQEDAEQNDQDSESSEPITE
jgi:segregation and condensation protein B